MPGVQRKDEGAGMTLEIQFIVAVSDTGDVQTHPWEDWHIQRKAAALAWMQELRGSQRTWGFTLVKANVTPPGLPVAQAITIKELP